MRTELIASVALSCLLVPAVLAQAPAPSPGAGNSGYAVTESGGTQIAPSGWVGRTITNKSQGVGNTPETQGNSYEVLIKYGGKARRCPSAEGIVDGDFEYLLSVTHRTIVDGAPNVVENTQQVTAELKGQVGEDGKLQYVEVDATQLATTNGNTTRQRMQAQFVPGRGLDGAIEALSSRNIHEWEARSFNPQLSAILSTVLFIFSGPIYIEAQTYWGTANNCLELDLTPTSKQKALQPSESIAVDVRFKGKEGQAAPPKGTIVRADAEQNQGRAVLTRAAITPDASGAVTYTAPPRRPAGKGFFVAAVSGAGVASSNWFSAGSNNYELQFESTIISRDPIDSAQSRAAGTVQLTGSDKPWRLYPDGKLYHLYNGVGALSIQTAPLPNRDPCSPMISGSGTTQFTVVDTYIDISDRYDRNGMPAGGHARIEMAYHVGMGVGETENVPFVLNYRCVLLPERAMPYPFWSSAYVSGRAVEGDVNFLRDWTYVGRDGVVATKTLRGNCGGMCDEEVSVLTLRQVDPPPAP